MPMDREPAAADLHAAAGGPGGETGHGGGSGAQDALTASDVVRTTDWALAKDTAAVPRPSALNAANLKEWPAALGALHTLEVPRRSRRRSRSPDTMSLLSTDDLAELRQVASLQALDTDDAGLQSPGLGLGLKKSLRQRLRRSWVRNKGVFLVFLAQIFGVSMSIGIRTLENLGRADSGDGEQGKAQDMDPFQIMFVRMSVTMTLATAYMAWAKTPGFPLGPKEVRGLLCLRGFGGFFGVIGMYWSLMYLPLADATVLTFLGPLLTCFACAKLLGQPFTRTEQVGGLVSLLGVVLIARPASIFAGGAPADDAAEGDSDGLAPPSARERLLAVGCAMVGVCGAVVAYTTIRCIGRRAHALVSVNYFATWSTLVSGAALAFAPGIHFVLPTTALQWGLLALIGVGGFLGQFLMTSGLRYEGSSRATLMMYSSMLFALGADRVVFGVTPGVWSILGSVLILGSAIVVALQNEGEVEEEGEGEGADAAGVYPKDEEALLGDVEGEDERAGGESAGESGESGESSRPGAENGLEGSAAAEDAAPAAPARAHAD